MSSPSDQRKDDLLKMLVQPKVCHQKVFNRPTVYWTDKILSAFHKYTVPVLTARQEVLSRYKKVNPDYREDRLTAEWPVTKAALRAEATPRLQQLAQPRSFTDVWEVNRPLCPLVTKGALTAVPSARIVALAKPKYLSEPSDKVRRKSLHAPIVRIARLDELAKPRTYAFDSRNPYRVPKAALEYVPTPRILEISRPARAKAKAAAHH